MSIRSQLLLRLTLVTILLVGGTSWLAYRDIQDETRELFDAQLSRSARLILSLAQSQLVASGFSRIQQYLDENGLAMMYFNFDDGIENDAGINDNGHIYETRLAFQIWDDEGNLLVKSYNAPLEPMSNKDNGYSNMVINGHHWRTFSLRDTRAQYRCVTAERIDVRNDMIRKISNDLFIMFAILIPALFAVLFFSIYRGLRPLQRLAAQIGRRDSDNLELLTRDNDYSEIATIKAALNRLLQRLHDALAREKRITSDAAHELRTPLAAIRLHAELARNAKTPEQKNESLDQVVQGVDRSTHLVEQLLVLARLEPELLARDFSDINLTELVIEESSLLSPLAIDKNIEMTFDESGKVMLYGNEASLRLLVRNLLTNAINYTPAGGAVRIRLNRNGDNINLVIEDNGPGIPAQERERVTQRFYRGEEHNTPGCGIGLSIVDRVVQIHHGKLKLQDADSGQGLKVSVRFSRHSTAPTDDS